MKVQSWGGRKTREARGGKELPILWLVPRRTVWLGVCPGLKAGRVGEGGIRWNLQNRAPKRVSMEKVWGKCGQTKGTLRGENPQGFGRII